MGRKCPYYINVKWTSVSKVCARYCRGLFHNAAGLREVKDFSERPLFQIDKLSEDYDLISLQAYNRRIIIVIQN